MHHHRRPTGRMPASDAGVHFTTSSGGVGGGSGTSSPPLWSGKSGNLSPPSLARLQAIEKGQQELMEMVRSMPDTSYELSLRDLVELPKPAPASESSPAAGGRRWRARGAPPEMKQGKGSSSSANGSGGDFKLKMFFPPSFGGSKSRSRKGRVSPEKYLDSGDWFKKRLSDHNHKISRSRRLGGMIPLASCWPFFHGNKSKGGKG